MNKIAKLLLIFVAFAANAQTEPTIRTEFVKFESKGIMLAGTILKPENPKVALVIVHGSGQEKRMLEFATLLAKKGIAILTYDKRGVGESGGVYAGPEVGTNNIDSTNLNLLSIDASSATNALKKYLQNKNTPIGLIGFSQAGWIIPLTAKLNKDVKFMVIFSGPVITSLEQLRFQFYTTGNQNFWETHTEEDAREHTLKDPDKYQFIAVNPLDALSTIKTPGLWIFGGKDIQVPVNLSIERLKSLKSKETQYEIKQYPELGHNTVSPNPVESGVLTLEMDISKDMEGSILLVDITGKKCYETSIALVEGKNQHTISTENLPNGFYVLMVRTENGIMSRKIQVTK